jgi:hypothetical protein
MITKMPTKLQGKLFKAAATYINMFPGSKHPNSTPMQLLEHRKPDLKNMHLVPFGTVAMLHVSRDNKLKQFKTDAKSVMEVILGPTPHSHSTMQCFVLDTEEIVSKNDFLVLPTVPENFPWPLKANSELKGNARVQIKTS